MTIEDGPGRSFWSRRSSVFLPPLLWKRERRKKSVILIVSIKSIRHSPFSLLGPGLSFAPGFEGSSVSIYFGDVG